MISFANFEALRARRTALARDILLKYLEDPLFRSRYSVEAGMANAFLAEEKRQWSADLERYNADLDAGRTAAKDIKPRQSTDQWANQQNPAEGR